MARFVVANATNGRNKNEGTRNAVPKYMGGGSMSMEDEPGIGDEVAFGYGPGR